MTDFEFTRVYESGDDYKDSSYVQAVYHNENEDFVVVDLDGTYYQYNNVPADEVADLVSASSVGSYFNTDFKPAYGPSVELGEWFEVNEYAVPVTKNTPGTPKGLEDNRAVSGRGSFTFTPVANPDKDRYGDGKPMFVDAGTTTEYDLNRFDTPLESHDVFEGDDEEPTKEFSLNLPEPEQSIGAPAGESHRVIVHFTLDGQSKKYKYDATALSVEDAIEELNTVVGQFKAKGKVRKVVVKFD